TLASIGVGCSQPGSSSGGTAAAPPPAAGTVATDTPGATQAGTATQGPRTSAQGRVVSAQAAPPCHRSDVTANFAQTEGAAGHRYMKARLTNASPPSCAIFGYGGLKLVGPVPSQPDVPPTNLLRDLSPKPSLVVLAPGQAADKQLHYTAVPGDGD